MAFNEDNVTEQMCIEVAKQAGYEYITADELREAKNDVIVEPLLQEALIKINHITRSKTPVRDFYLKIFGGFRIIAYICNMKTKNLYMNIGLSMRNTLIINVLPPLFMIGKLQMRVIV